MISPELEARFLRPIELKDNLDSSWSDKQHAWIKQDGAFAYVTVVEEGDNDEVVVEGSDGLVTCPPSRHECF